MKHPRVPVRTKLRILAQVTAAGAQHAWQRLRESALRTAVNARGRFADRLSMKLLRKHQIQARGNVLNVEYLASTKGLRLFLGFSGGEVTRLQELESASAAQVSRYLDRFLASAGAWGEDDDLLVLGPEEGRGTAVLRGFKMMGGVIAEDLLTALRMRDPGFRVIDKLAVPMANGNSFILSLRRYPDGRTRLALKMEGEDGPPRQFSLVSTARLKSVIDQPEADAESPRPPRRRPDA